MQKTVIYVAALLVVVSLTIAAAAWNRHPIAAAVISVQSPLQPSASSDPAPLSDSMPLAGGRGSDEIVIPPLPANATKVPDAHLLKLSEMVNLTNAEERHINREQWTRAVPIARQLVQGPCDCEQRNWLNHFIAMGDSALAGSDEDYYKSAVLMRKMARNDQQLAEHPEFFAH